eukprot:gene16260-78_t
MDELDSTSTWVDTASHHSMEDEAETFLEVPSPSVSPEMTRYTAHQQDTSRLRGRVDDSLRRTKRVIKDDQALAAISEVEQYWDEYHSNLERQMDILHGEVEMGRKYIADLVECEVGGSAGDIPSHLVKGWSLGTSAMVALSALNPREKHLASSVPDSERSVSAQLDRLHLKCRHLAAMVGRTELEFIPRWAKLGANPLCGLNSSSDTQPAKLAMLSHDCEKLKGQITSLQNRRACNSTESSELTKLHQALGTIQSSMDSFHAKSTSRFEQGRLNDVAQKSKQLCSLAHHIENEIQTGSNMTALQDIASEVAAKTVMLDGMLAHASTGDRTSVNVSGMLKQFSFKAHLLTKEVSTAISNAAGADHTDETEIVVMLNSTADLLRKQAGQVKKLGHDGVSMLKTFDASKSSVKYFRTLAAGQVEDLANWERALRAFPKFMNGKGTEVHGEIYELQRALDETKSALQESEHRGGRAIADSKLQCRRADTNAGMCYTILEAIQRGDTDPRFWEELESAATQSNGKGAAPATLYSFVMQHRPKKQ